MQTNLQLFRDKKSEHSSDDQDQLQNQQTIEQNEKDQISKQKISDYRFQYAKIMGLESQETFQYFPPVMSQELLKRLSHLNITYHPKSFYLTDILFDNQTKDYTITEAKVYLGYFTLKLIILNKSFELPRFSTKQNTDEKSLIDGCFGKILFKQWHKGRVQQQTFSIIDSEIKENFAEKIIFFDKNTPISNDSDYSYQKLFLTIIQYSFAKLTYALEIGPKIQLMFGFDLICYRNCVKFFMEECKNLLSKRYAMPIQKIEETLKSSLKRLHTLSIVHNDIKLDNIMISPTLEKVVFIDFGLTHLVKEKIGRKTQSLFKGSYYFVSDQMKNLIVKKNGFVDLYWNDLHCLMKSIQFMKINNREIQSFNTIFNVQNTTSQMIDPLDSSHKPSIKKNIWETQQRSQYISGKAIIPLISQESISIFDKEQTEFLSFQLFYLLYRKKIDLFKLCLSSQNNVTQSQQVYLMNIIMKFLEELQGCPIYDEIYYENYTNYKYNVDYQTLKYQTQSEEEINNISSNLESEKFSSVFSSINSNQKIQLRYAEVNFGQGFCSVVQSLQSKWIIVFLQIVDNVSNLTFQQNQASDFTQFLENIDKQKPQIIQGLCDILVNALTIPQKNQKVMFYIAQIMIKSFPSGFLKTIYKIWNQNKNQQEYQFELPSLSMKALIIKYVQKFRRTKIENIFSIRPIQNSSLLLMYTILCKFIQEYIYCKQVLNVIQKRKIPLFINPKVFHTSMNNTTVTEKITLLLFMNYIDQNSYKEAFRVIKKMKSQFNEKYNKQAVYFCLIVFLKNFNSILSFRKAQQILTQIKVLRVLISQKNKDNVPKALSRKSVGFQDLYDFESNQEYVDFFLDYLQIQSYVNKGMADFNAFYLSQKTNQFIAKISTFYNRQINKGRYNYLFSHLIILKILINDEMKDFENNLELGKSLFQYYTKGMNRRDLGSKLLLRSYSYLGIQQKRVNIKKFKKEVSEQQEGLQIIQNFKIQKFFRKKVLQSIFLAKYKFYKPQMEAQCKKQFNQILEVIRSLEPEDQVYLGFVRTKITMTLQLYSIVISYKIQCLFSIIDTELSKYIQIQLIQNSENHTYQIFMVLNQIIHEFVTLFYIKEMEIKLPIINFYFFYYQKFIKKVFHDDFKMYPVEYWIFDRIIKKTYNHNQFQVTNVFCFGRQVIDKIKQYRTMIESCMFLEFAMSFIRKCLNFNFKMASYEQSRFQCDQQKIYILNLVNECINSILLTKRHYLLFYQVDYTIIFMEILLIQQKSQQICLMMNQMSKFMNKFPGQKNMNSLSLLCENIFQIGIQKVKTNQIFLSITQKPIFLTFHKQLPEMTPFYIYLSLKVQKCGNDLNLITIAFLKRLEIGYHRLPKYMKNRLFGRYLQLIINFYFSVGSKQKSYKLFLKFMRIRKYLQFIDEEQAKIKYYIQKLNNYKGNINRKAITIQNNYILSSEKLIQSKIICKIKTILSSCILVKDQSKSLKIASEVSQKMLKSCQMYDDNKKLTLQNII